MHILTPLRLYEAPSISWNVPSVGMPGHPDHPVLWLGEYGVIRDHRGEWPHQGLATYHQPMQGKRALPSSTRGTTVTQATITTRLKTES